MRKDMAKLIVKGHSRSKDRSNGKKFGPRDWEDSMERGKMKEGYGWGDGPRDHLNPLLNYLKSNVGRPWSKVYAEICAVADARSFEGKHLREHIDGWVFSEEELLARRARRWYGGWRDFYYDSKGILRRFGSENERRKSYWKDRQNPDECAIEGRPYVRINNCWFEASYHHYTECREELDYFTQKKVKRYYPKRETRKVRQLGKKELKTLGLSNEPGWKWYDKSK
jgi:hypothetical protein